jgi:hypothetical protein
VIAYWGNELASLRSFWSAPAERSGDGALVRTKMSIGHSKAASRSACRRIPKPNAFHSAGSWKIERSLAAPGY